MTRQLSNVYKQESFEQTSESIPTSPHQLQRELQERQQVQPLLIPTHCCYWPPPTTTSIISTQQSQHELQGLVHHHVAPLRVRLLCHNRPDAESAAGSSQSHPEEISSERAWLIKKDLPYKGGSAQARQTPGLWPVFGLTHSLMPKCYSSV